MKILLYELALGLYEHLLPFDDSVSSYFFDDKKYFAK
jgi:hypothetical protein